MATVVIMPKQGQSVESCILTEFKKKKGDSVAVGDILFSYETDQSLVRRSRPSGRHGTGRIFRQRGRNSRTDERHGNRQRRRVDGRVPPGRRDGCAGRDTRARSGGSTCSGSGSSACGSCRDDRRSGIRSDRRFVAVSPRAKMLAAKEAVNASALAGSGPHGRVIERDVKAALEAAPKTTPLAKAIMKETGAPLPRPEAVWPAWPRVPTLAR